MNGKKSEEEDEKIGENKRDDIIFEVIDKTGRKIRLTKTQWTHIREFHEHVEDIEEIILTLQKADKIIVDEREDVNYFFKHFKHKNHISKFLKVIVKYLNEEGIVLSAHFVRNIR